MNINENTQVAMPSNPERNNAAQAGAPTPIKLSKPKKNDHMGAKVAAAVLGGMAVAGLGAGAVYAYNHMGNEPEDNNDQLAQDNTPHETHEHNVHVTETNIHVTPAPEPVPEPLPDPLPSPSPAPAPKPSPEPPKEEGELVVNDMMITDIMGDDKPEIVAALTVDGEPMLLIDEDMDGVFDSLVADYDGNGDITSDEFRDVSDAGITVNDVYLTLAETNPDKAYAFLEQLTTYYGYEDGVENGPYADVVDAYGVDEDGNVILLDGVDEDDNVVTPDGSYNDGLADENILPSDDVIVEPEAGDVNDDVDVVVSNDDENAIFVSADVDNDGGDAGLAHEAVAEVAEHNPAPEPEPAPEVMPEENQWADASHDMGGGDLDAAGHDMVDNTIDC